MAPETRANHDIVIGSKIINSDGNLMTPEEGPGAASVQIVWIKLGDVYLTYDNLGLINVAHSLGAEFSTVTLTLTCAEYRVVNYLDEQYADWGVDRHTTGLLTDLPPERR